MKTSKVAREVEQQQQYGRSEKENLGQIILD